MSTQSLITRIIKALDSLTANDTLFTMLDLSNAVKVDGGPFVKHDEVRDLAKPLITAYYSHYNVTPIQVQTTNGVTTANLYFPVGSTPSEYKNRSQVAAAPKVTSTASPVQVAVSPVAPAPVVAKPTVPAYVANSRGCKDATVRLDGKIEIPYELLVTAGLDGTLVDVVNHPNSISIVPATTGTRYANAGFRLSKKTLAASNFDIVSHFTICAFTDKVLITKKV